MRLVPQWPVCHSERSEESNPRPGGDPLINHSPFFQLNLHFIKLWIKYGDKMWTVILLTISNIFMTIAWYGHLKYKNVPMWIVILISWGIAFFEYCFQVPANRIGYGEFNAAQLKTIQEVIHLLYSVYFNFISKRTIQVEYAVGFGLMILAVFFVFKKW